MNKILHNIIYEGIIIYLSVESMVCVVNLLRQTDPIRLHTDQKCSAGTD